MWTVRWSGYPQYAGAPFYRDNWLDVLWCTDQPQSGDRDRHRSVRCPLAHCSLAGGSGFKQWVCSCLYGTIQYAIAINVIGQKLSHLSTNAITLLGFMTIFPPALIGLFGFTDFTMDLSATEGAWMSLFYLCILGVVGTAIAVILFNKLIKMTTPIFASSITLHSGGGHALGRVRWRATRSAASARGGPHSSGRLSGQQQQTQEN